MTFGEYLRKVVTQQRLDDARQHLVENSALLQQVRQRFNMQPRFIVALWGVESDFGRTMGSYFVPSALATLAYEGRRGAMFRAELIAALKIIDQGNVRVDNMVGSWAGAMGQCQFMPTTFLQYAVDFDGDGRRDIWTNRTDVLGSIANYMSRLGWRGNEGWGQQVVVPGNFDSPAGRARQPPDDRRMGPARGAAGRARSRLPAASRPGRWCCRMAPAARRCWSTTISAPSRSGITRTFSRPLSAISPTASTAASRVGFRCAPIVAPGFCLCSWRMAGFGLVGCGGASPDPQLNGPRTRGRSAGRATRSRAYQVNGVWYYPKVTTITTRPAPPRGTARASTASRRRTARSTT